MATSTSDQNKNFVMGKILLFSIIFDVFLIQTCAISSEEGIHYFKQLDFLTDHTRSKRDSETFSYGNEDEPDTSSQQRNVRDTEEQDKQCQVIAKDKLKDGVSMYTFEDTNENLALMWTGDHGESLLALTTLEYFIFAAPSHVWVSKDFGKNFENIDSKINGATIKGSHGIFRHLTAYKKVLLVAYPTGGDPYKSKLYITIDGGDSFEEVEINFTPEGPIIPNPIHPDWLLAHSPNQDYTLWFSGDFGRSWQKVRQNVIEYAWGTPEQKTEELVFMSVMPEGKRVDNDDLSLSLVRMDPYGRNEKTIKDNIYNFGCQGKFLYAATDKEGTDNKNKTKVLHISTDGGKKWNIAQVPGIFGDMFFAVLDMSEGMVILHVDDAGDTGHGKLYTSDGDGIIFSLSLDKHLFPNHATVTDFYKVQSMRGVYMASQMDEDDGIHTRISFDRAGEWDFVDAPKGAKCREGIQDELCKLQIHSRYSQVKQIKVPSIPISNKQAPGLILAHGNVADGLELSDPDVYVTSDGGYNWTKALDGPHQYAITNFGGLIVAISKKNYTTNTIHFSYDEGHCWHQYNFTEEPLVITGLLPEPSSRSLTVSVWGFGEVDRMWRVFTLNFSTVLTEPCKSGDFLVWEPHERNGKAGCFLGKKESFRKVKPDAFCRISKEFEIVPVSDSACECEKVDYECDFGFYRTDNSDVCQLSTYVDISDLDICKGGNEDEIKTNGYRKIPGDQCKGGYQPHRAIEDLHKKCSQDMQESNYMVQKKHKSTVAALMALLSVLVIILVTIYYIQSKGLCKRKSRGIYRYSELNQGDHEEQVLDVSPGPDTYHDDSDDDMLG